MDDLEHAWLVYDDGIDHISRAELRRWRAEMDWRLTPMAFAGLVFAHAIGAVARVFAAMVSRVAKRLRLQLTAFGTHVMRRAG
jgi:hypothetical protein